MIYYSVCQTTLGLCLIALQNNKIIWFSFNDNVFLLEQEFLDCFCGSNVQKIEATKLDIIQNILMDIENNNFYNLNAYQICMIGTQFQKRVWTALREIPYSKRISYTELAKNISQPSAIRAVANACAKNKIAILIPCHRIVRKNGDISGYRWGTERKQTLLSLELNHCLSL